MHDRLIRARTITPFGFRRRSVPGHRFDPTPTSSGPNGGRGLPVWNGDTGLRCPMDTRLVRGGRVGLFPPQDDQGAESRTLESTGGPPFDAPAVASARVQELVEMAPGPGVFVPQEDPRGRNEPVLSGPHRTLSPL